MGDRRFFIDLEDEVVRGAIVVHQGNIMAPVPRQAPAPTVPPPAPTKSEEKPATLAITPWKKTSREVAAVSAGMGSMVGLGKLTGAAFMDQVFTFGLAGLVGYRWSVVWGVAPALHSPLMSVTNAISGMVGVGGLFVMGGGYLPGTIPQALGCPLCSAGQR